MEETERRREIQLSYNALHGITPKTVEKRIADLIRIGADENKGKRGRGRGKTAPTVADTSKLSVAEEIERLTAEMKKAASELRFEEAAYLRDKIRSLEK